MHRHEGGWGYFQKAVRFAGTGFSEDDAGGSVWQLGIALWLS